MEKHYLRQSGGSASEPPVQARVGARRGIEGRELREAPALSPAGLEKGRSCTWWRGGPVAECLAARGGVPYTSRVAVQLAPAVAAGPQWRASPALTPAACARPGLEQTMATLVGTTLRLGGGGGASGASEPQGAQ